MSGRQLFLNHCTSPQAPQLSKTELLFIPGKTNMDLSVTVEEPGCNQGSWWNCTCLSHTTRLSMSTLLYYISWWLVLPLLRANKAHCHDSSLFWHLSGGINFQPVSGQQNHSPSSWKDSRLIFSDFTSTPHNMTFHFCKSAVWCFFCYKWSVCINALTNKTDCCFLTNWECHQCCT